MKLKVIGVTALGIAALAVGLNIYSDNLHSLKKILQVAFLGFVFVLFCNFIASITHEWILTKRYRKLKKFSGFVDSKGLENLRAARNFKLGESKESGRVISKVFQIGNPSLSALEDEVQPDEETLGSQSEVTEENSHGRYSNTNQEKVARVRQAQQNKIEEQAKAFAEQKRNKNLARVAEKYSEMERMKLLRVSQCSGPVFPGEELQEKWERESKELKDLREQQDAELEESLKADSLLLEAVQKSADEADRVKILEMMEEEMKQEIAQNCKKKRQILRDALPLEPPEGTEGRTVLAVRFPDSSVQKRAFLATDTIHAVYAWVESCEEMDLFPQAFVLTTIYPRTKLVSSEWNTRSLLEAGLTPKCLLAIEENS